MAFSIKNFFRKATTQTQLAYSYIKSAIAVYGSGNPTSNIRDGYVTNSDCYSIVRRIAKTAANIPIYAYKVKNANKLKDYQTHLAIKDYSTRWQIKAAMLKNEAIEQLPLSHKLNQIIYSPNKLYDKSEFIEGFYTMRLLTGNAYIYAPIVDFGVDAGKPTELWILPTNYVQPKVVASTFPRELQSYQFTLVGVVDLSKDEVFHSRYFNPQYGYMGEELVGLSPITAGVKILQRSSDEVDYSVASFQNSGISGIVTNESIDNGVTSETLGKLKSDFYNEAQGTKNARKLLFQAGKINYIQIGLSPVDMELLKSEVQTFKRLCNLYGVSDVLFNNGDASTESNVKEMIKQLYTNAALPEVNAFVELLNRNVATKFNTNSEQYFYDYDLSGIVELQSDMKDMADVFSKLPVFIPNVVFDMMGLGKVDTEEANKVYIKSGYTPLDELSIDVPNLP